MAIDFKRASDLFLGSEKELALALAIPVADRRVGRVRFYRLLPDPLAAVETWIAEYRRFWPEKLSALGAYLERLHGEEPGV